MVARGLTCPFCTSTFSPLCLPLFTYPAAQVNRHIVSNTRTINTAHPLSTNPAEVSFWCESGHSYCCLTLLGGGGLDILCRLSASSVRCKPTQSTWSSKKAGFSNCPGYYLLLQPSLSCREDFFSFFSGLDLQSNQQFRFLWRRAACGRCFALCVF